MRFDPPFRACCKTQSFLTAAYTVDESRLLDLLSQKDYGINQLQFLGREEVTQ